MSNILDLANILARLSVRDNALARSCERVNILALYHPYIIPILSLYHPFRSG